MTATTTGFAIETLALPHENGAEHRCLYDKWMAAHSPVDPIEQGYIDQAVTALIEKRRIQRIRATLRTGQVRTAFLYFDRAQEDYIAKCMTIFAVNPEQGVRALTRSAAGCRWAIAYWKKLQHMLDTDGTWYGEYRVGAIHLQGVSAHPDRLCISAVSFRTWLDCLVCNPNPKQPDIDRIMGTRRIPKTLADRDVPLWPGNPAESRARLRAIVDRELSRLEPLEKLLRVQYDEPARAEARESVLAEWTEEELPLLRAERMYDLSYDRAVAALLKVRKQTAAMRRPMVRAEAEEPDVDEVRPSVSPIFTADVPVRSAGAEPVVGWSEHRFPVENWGSDKTGKRRRSNREDLLKPELKPPRHRGTGKCRGSAVQDDGRPVIMFFDNSDVIRSIFSTCNAEDTDVLRHFKAVIKGESSLNASASATLSSATFPTGRGCPKDR